MATDRQIEANRRNATKSTGPRSLEGKAQSRHNALTHGLTARHTLLLPGEDRVEFEEFRRTMFTSLAPKDPLEDQLVERIVDLLWRLRRVPAFEVAVLEWIKQVEGKNHDEKGHGFMNRSLELVNDSTDADRFSRAGRDVLEIGRAFEILLNMDLSGKLSRYETHLQRQLSLSLKELRELQANRPDMAKLVNAREQTLAPEPVTLSDQELLTSPVSRIRRTQPAPVDVEGVPENAGASLDDFSGMLDDA